MNWKLSSFLWPSPQPLIMAIIWETTMSYLTRLYLCKLTNRLEIKGFLLHSSIKELLNSLQKIFSISLKSEINFAIIFEHTLWGNYWKWCSLFVKFAQMHSGVLEQDCLVKWKYSATKLSMAPLQLWFALVPAETIHVLCFISVLRLPRACWSFYTDCVNLKCAVHVS